MKKSRILTASLAAVSMMTVSACVTDPNTGERKVSRTVLGTAGGALLGLIFGWLAIRRQGIYFSMITLALAQMLFFESDEICETSYKDRGGKYLGQTGVTLPRT